MYKPSPEAFPDHNRGFRGDHVRAPSTSIA